MQGIPSVSIVTIGLSSNIAVVRTIVKSDDGSTILEAQSQHLAIAPEAA
jgi:hypothetical protein